MMFSDPALRDESTLLHDRHVSDIPLRGPVRGENQGEDGGSGGQELAAETFILKGRIRVSRPEGQRLSRVKISGYGEEFRLFGA